MPHIDWSSRLLSVRLGLGDLIAKPCHGYANGCVCEDCSERSRLVLQEVCEPAGQPWEPKAA